MKPCMYLSVIIVILQLWHSNEGKSANYEHQVAFFCDHPSMVYRNGKWYADYQQDCIENEIGIMTYCQQMFPDIKINSVESAFEKTNFTKWCDFKGQNCSSRIEIRPFKCLETSLNSDAVPLPKKCLSDNLGGVGDCKPLNDWVLEAKNHCTKRYNLKLRSYGLRGPCGKSLNSANPVFFTGVNLVCCPIDGSKMKPQPEDDDIFKGYLENGVLESDQEEDSMYDNSVNKLEKFETEKEEDLVDGLKNGENDLKKLWNSDPKMAKTREDKLISKFKKSSSETISRYLWDKEQLLNFHDERLKFIFTTKFEAAMSRLKKILKKPTKNEFEIGEAMKQVLNLLMMRRKKVMEEKMTGEILGSRIIDKLTLELIVIEKNITMVFNMLNQVPQFKLSIKQHLVIYFMRKFPRNSQGKIDKKDELIRKVSQLEAIISKYRYSSEEEDDDDFQVRFDLGLDEKDQNNKGRRRYPNKKLRCMLVYIIPAILLFIVSFISTVLFCRRRSSSRFIKGKDHYVKSRLVMSKDQERSLFKDEKNSIFVDPRSDGVHAGGYRDERDSTHLMHSV